MDESQTFLKVILTINYKSTIKLLIKDLSNSKCDNDNKKSLHFRLLTMPCDNAMAVCPLEFEIGELKACVARSHTHCVHALLCVRSVCR